MEQRDEVYVQEMRYEYREILRQLQESDDSLKKGERTRNRLKLAAVELLDEMGYRDLKVSDISDRAGVSIGTFYLYFANKTELSLLVLEEFIKHLDVIFSRRQSPRSPFQSIYEANLEWLKSLRANAGLFRCILQVGDEYPELSGLMHRFNMSWYKRTTKSVTRHFPSTGSKGENVVLLAVYSVGSMMDEIGRSLVVSPDPELAELVNQVTPSDTDLAEFLSLVWYRVLYGRSPDELLEAGASKTLVKLAMK